MNTHASGDAFPAEIMLVDDTPASLLMLTNILTKNGFRVRTAESGEKALESIKMKVPDLVLLDVMMPGLDGFEVCRILKGSPDTEKIPVVFLTALDDIENKISGFGAGGADFITKPFQMEEVLLRVNHQLEMLSLVRALEASNRSLLESRILLQSSIESQKDTFLFSINADYSYLYFNTAHKDIMKHAFGIDIGLGMNILSCITSDEDRIVAKKDYDLALSGKSHSTIRVYGVAKIAYYECFFNPILNAENKIIGATELSRDITERKHVEETLRQRLTEMEAIHTVTTALRTAKTHDDALPVILDETLTALGTNTGAIYLYDPGKNELVNAIARGWFRQFSDRPVSPGDGIVGEVFSTGQAHISKEVKSDPAVRQPIAPEGWYGVCLPIRADEIRVGTLIAALPPPRVITPEQIGMLESLAEIAGAALHRMKLYEETVRQLERLEALHSIDIAITANMDLQMTLNLLLDQVRTQLNADAARVLLLDPHAQVLEYAAGRGFRTQLVQTRIRLGGDFAGRVALERRTIQVDDSVNIRKSPQFAAFWGREGFSAYFGFPLLAKGQVKGVLEVYHRTPLHPEPDWFMFLGMVAGQAAIAIDNAQLFENLQRSNEELALAYDATIEGWSRALDLRDKETEGHTLRVTEMTLRLDKAMGISDSELVNVRRGTLLHDIGKMGVPDEILHKPSELTAEEWVVMRKHPQLAFDLLSPISYLKAALDIPYCHHEKWDGSGYPRGLKGEQIPLVARIFAIVDVWDALRSDRPYRLAWEEHRVVEHIKSLSGTHFDPQVVRMFLESEMTGQRS